jgi:hypothetical protein
MTKTTHTPGPWMVVAEHDISTHGSWSEGDDDLVVSARKVLRGGDGELGVVVIDMNDPNIWDDELLDANTRLIAAAPDLVTALAESIAQMEIVRRKLEDAGVANLGAGPLGRQCDMGRAVLTKVWGDPS